MQHFATSVNNLHWGGVWTTLILPYKLKESNYPSFYILYIYTLNKVPLMWQYKTNTGEKVPVNKLSVSGLEKNSGSQSLSTFWAAFLSLDFRFAHNVYKYMETVK